jgi:hypothetical protein
MPCYSFGTLFYTLNFLDEGLLSVSYRISISANTGTIPASAFLAIRSTVSTSFSRNYPHFLPIRGTSWTSYARHLLFSQRWTIHDGIRLPTGTILAPRSSACIVTVRHSEKRGLGLGVSDIALGTDRIAIVIVLFSCFAGAGTSSSKLEFEGADRARLDVRMLPVLVRDGLGVFIIL